MFQANNSTKIYSSLIYKNLYYISYFLHYDVRNQIKLPNNHFSLLVSFISSTCNVSFELDIYVATCSTTLHIGSHTNGH
jgi:hypothetical protein